MELNSAKQAPCPLGCASTVYQSKDPHGASHYAECEYALLDCDSCGEKVQRQDYQNHEAAHKAEDAEEEATEAPRTRPSRFTDAKPKSEDDVPEPPPIKQSSDNEAAQGGETPDDSGGGATPGTADEGGGTPADAAPGGDATPEAGSGGAASPQASKSQEKDKLSKEEVAANFEKQAKVDRMTAWKKL